jgi:hypothetical protein
MNTIITVAVTEAGMFIIGGGDPDHFLRPPHRHLPLRHLVPTVVPVLVDVDRRGADEEGPLLMSVLLMGKVVVGAAEVVEIIAVAMIPVEIVLVPVPVGEEEEVLLPPVPDLEKAHDERAVVAAAVEVATTAVVAAVIATVWNGRCWKKKLPNIKTPMSAGIVPKVKQHSSERKAHRRCPNRPRRFLTPRERAAEEDTVIITMTDLRVEVRSEAAVENEREATTTMEMIAATTTTKLLNIPG